MKQRLSDDTITPTISEHGKGTAIVIGGLATFYTLPNKDNTQGFWPLHSNRQGALNIGCTAWTRHE
jgi:hypothetical protein